MFTPAPNRRTESLLNPEYLNRGCPVYTLYGFNKLDIQNLVLLVLLNRDQLLLFLSLSFCTPMARFIHSFLKVNNVLAFSPVVAARSSTHSLRHETCLGKELNAEKTIVHVGTVETETYFANV